MTGGAGTLDIASKMWSFPSWLFCQPRLSVKMWSCESMHVPPTSPVAHLCRLPLASLNCGNGFGQNGSTLNCGVGTDCAIVRTHHVHVVATTSMHIAATVKYFACFISIL